MIHTEAKNEVKHIDPSAFDTLVAPIDAVRQWPAINMPAIKQGQNQAELRSIIVRQRKYELTKESFRLMNISRGKLANELLSGNFPN